MTMRVSNVSSCTHTYTYDALSSTHVAARACTGSPACNALQGRKYQNAGGALRQRENFTSRALSFLTGVFSLPLLFNIASSRSSRSVLRLLNVYQAS